MLKLRIKKLGPKTRYVFVLEITMTTGWLLLLVVLMIASSDGQTTIDNVEEDCNSMQDTQQQLLEN